MRSNRTFAKQSLGRRQIYKHRLLASLGIVRKGRFQSSALSFPDTLSIYGKVSVFCEAEYFPILGIHLLTLVDISWTSLDCLSVT
jgi:hypothetical protein